MVDEVAAKYRLAGPRMMMHGFPEADSSPTASSTCTLTVTEKDPLWVEGADAAGATRLDRIQSLRRSFEAAGIPVRLDVVPGAAHNGFDVLDHVRDFFANVEG